MPTGPLPTPADTPDIREAATATGALESALSLLPTFDPKSDAIDGFVNVTSLADHLEGFLGRSGWAIYRTDCAPRPVDATTRDKALNYAIATMVPKESYSPGSPEDVLTTADRMARFLAGQPDSGDTVVVPVEVIRRVVDLASGMFDVVASSEVLWDPSPLDARAVADLAACLPTPAPNPDDEPF